MTLSEAEWSEWRPIASIGEVVDPHLDGPGVIEVRLARDGEALSVPHSGGLDQKGVVFIGHASDSLRSEIAECQERGNRDHISKGLSNRRFFASSRHEGESTPPELPPEFTLECRWVGTDQNEASACADERLRLYIWRFGDYPPLNQKPDVQQELNFPASEWSVQEYIEKWQERPGRKPENPVIYCADVGLISKSRFGWARGPESSFRLQKADRSDIRSLARAVSEDLAEGLAVALGFECPLYIPVRDRPEAMRKAREGEGNRPWSAAAGLGSLTVGLSQSVWLLKMIQKLLEGTGRAFIDWDRFVDHGRGLFVWEAFVTGDAKAPATGAGSHAEDAAIAIESFRGALPNPWDANALQEDSVHSLIGAALLRTGWSDDLELLSRPCLVIRS